MNSEPAQSVRVHLRDGGWGESSICVNKDELQPEILLADAPLSGAPAVLRFFVGHGYAGRCTVAKREQCSKREQREQWEQCVCLSVTC